MLFHSVWSGAKAELLVAYRFMEAERVVSWPLAPCRYDLIVDGGDALYRVQVKQGVRTLAKGTTPVWTCVLRNSRRRPAAPATAFDYLCFVLDPDTIYVIPSAMLISPETPTRFVASLKIGTHNTRFAPYINRFGLGNGTLKPTIPISRGTTLKNYPWATSKGPSRKAHHRLTTQEVEELRKLPIRIFKFQPHVEGMIPIEQVAQQFNVTVTTLRNLLQGKRKDLGPQM